MKLTNNFLVLSKNSLDVSDLLKNSGKSEDEITKTISTTGISKISYASPRLLTEFVFLGLQNLVKYHKDIFKGIDAIIVVSQSFDQRIPSLSTRIQKFLNLESRTFCIDLMDGCSGFIKALSLGSTLQREGFKKILIIAGDINSMMTKNSDLGTKILFGDGVSISILESDEFFLETKIYNDGDDNNVISCSVNENQMHMDGFEVFRFTKKNVPKLINDYLTENKIQINSFDLVAFHQASKLVVNTICNSLKFNNNFGEDFACGEIGNLGAGSIGAWLTQIENLNESKKLKLLAVGYGSGLSWGLARISIEINKNEVVYV